MSRNPMLTLAGSAALLLAAMSCTLSVDAFVPRASAAFDQRLVGTWQSGDSDRAVISRASEGNYAIQYVSKGKTGRFEGRLGRLGARIALDVWPAPRDGDIPEPYTGMLIAAHGLFVLDIGQDEIRAAAIDPDSLGAALRSGLVRLPVDSTKDHLLLRGSTDELRAVLGPYIARHGALERPDVWRRVR